MITRVTHQSTQRAAVTNLQATQSRLAQLQERASSGKMITKASDDPAKAADAMALRKEQQASAQYSRNIQDGVSWLTSIDTAINTSVSYLNRARDLVVRGANSGATNAEAREALAVEPRRAPRVPRRAGEHHVPRPLGVRRDRRRTGLHSGHSHR